jgi:hypothetical protein
MRANRLLVTVALLGALGVGAAPASAEWFGDLYLGGAFTENSDLTAKGSFNGSPFEITARDVRFDSSVTGGGRLGYWFEKLPWLGLGLDIAYFAPNISAQSVDTNVKLGGVATNIGSVPFDRVKLDVTDVSFDLMLRWPGLVASSQFPKGRLQPYLTVDDREGQYELRATERSIQPRHLARPEDGIRNDVDAHAEHRTLR